MINDSCPPSLSNKIITNNKHSWCQFLDATPYMWFFWILYLHYSNENWLNCRQNVVLNWQMSVFLGGEVCWGCILSWWYQFLPNSVVKSVVTFFSLLFALLGSVNPARRNWLRTVASEITGVKLTSAGWQL